MKRYYWTLISLILFPGLSFAQSVTNFNIFQPSAIQNGTDLSISYLGDLFGVVDGVLHGSGSQIMGQMFMVFNAGALVLGGIIVIYVTLISLLNTANEGEMLGRKWNSIWIPLRVVMGIALLIPKSTGYCAIQIFMMWVIVQGVGLADTVWNQVTNYLWEGGVIVQQSLNAQPQIGYAAKNVFRQMVCLQGIQNQLSQAYDTLSKQGQNPPLVPSLLATVNPLYGGDCKVGICTAPIPYFDSSYETGNYKWSQLNGACGSVTWLRVSSLPNFGIAANSPILASFNQSARIAIQQMYLDSESPAETVVNNFIYPSSGGSTTITADEAKSYIGTRIFLDMAEDYEGIMYPAENQIANIAKRAIMLLWIHHAQSYGWMTAGQYYIDLAAQNSLAGNTIFMPPDPSGATSVYNAMRDKLTSGNLPGGFYSNMNLSALENQIKPESTLNGVIQLAPTMSFTYGDKTDPISNTIAKAVSTGLGVAGFVSVIFAPLTPLIHIIQGFVNLAAAQQTNANPVMAIAALGDGLIGLVIEVWVIGAVAIAATTGVLGLILCTEEATMVTTVLEWIIPLLWGICGLLFVEGSVMAYYVPLIPFILFLFGSIGWLMATLEAMVAAPLVALGITHPEGAEVLGKSDPAVLLLVNVFMRPSMMIIGYIGGIILSYVTIWMLNQGFFSAYLQQVLSNLDLLTLIFSFAFMLIIYVTIVISILNYCFSLINVVPDKVLRWIGGQVEGIAGEAGRMAGEAKQGLQQASQATGEGMKGLAQAAGQRSDKSSQGEMTSKSKSGGSSAKGSQGGNQLQMGSKGGKKGGGNPPKTP